MPYTFVTEQISLGDFVLSGGEIPAIALLDAIARLQPGVLHDEQSHLQDSFNPSIGGLLDNPLHPPRSLAWRIRAACVALRQPRRNREVSKKPAPSYHASTAARCAQTLMEQISSSEHKNSS
jgi:hypothetical protein